MTATNAGDFAADLLQNQQPANTQTQTYVSHHRHGRACPRLVPAIHVFNSHLSVRRGSVDARIKSGQDELVGAMHYLNDPEHWVVLQ
jgi:hypothetical protein